MDAGKSAFLHRCGLVAPGRVFLNLTIRSLPLPRVLSSQQPPAFGTAASATSGGGGNSGASGMVAAARAALGASGAARDCSVEFTVNAPREMGSLCITGNAEALGGRAHAPPDPSCMAQSALSPDPARPEPLHSVAIEQRHGMVWRAHA